MCAIGQPTNLPSPVGGPGAEEAWANMEELLKTNDLVLISFVEALMRDAGIEVLVLDQNMSVIEGSLGVLPRRILVPDDRLEEARQILQAAGIGGELEKPSKK